jgi:hypothetical protein
MQSAISGDQLHDLWERCLTIGGETPSSDYGLCYPEALVASLAHSTIEGCKALGLRSFTEASDDTRHIPALLSEAWNRFRAEPDAYADWERQRLSDLWREMGFAVTD